MTDELLLTFSLVPLITVAIQRGYHEYKELILQTPNYYLNPFPLSKINITPVKEDPSLFKSNTVIAPITVMSEPSQFIDPVYNPIVSEFIQPIDTFTLNGYTPSGTIKPIHTISNEPNQLNDTDTFTLNGSYTPSGTIKAIHTISNEPNQLNDTDTFILSNSVSYVSNPVITVSASTVNELPKTFKLTNNRSYTSKPIITVRQGKMQIPNSHTNMLSNTMISFSNVLFTKPKVKYVNEITNKSKEWKHQLQRIRQYNLPARMDAVNETIMIAFQPLPYIEYCLRKMILHLPTWSHTVVCGNINTDLITSWNLPIHVISLDIDTITAEQYNELVLMPSFWELFYGETLLLYQEYSTPLEYDIRPYLLHMYKEIEPGISIRNKSYIINYLNINPPEEGMSEQLYFKQYAI
jgi:hypothetical protein